MTTFSRPGAYVQEAIAQQYIVPADGTDAVAAFVGSLPKGPTTPTLVSSWAEFTKYFGGLDFTVPTSIAAYQFFANGGRNVYIRRVTQSGATTASVTLNDASAAATLTISAKNPGSWATSTATSGLSVEALDYGNSGRFSLVVYGAPFYSGADSRSNIIEQFTDLSVNSSDPRYVVSVVSASSAYISVTDLSTSSLKPLADGTLKPLTGGSDGSGGITPAILSATTTDFDNINSPLLFNLPDAAYFSSSNWSIAYSAFLNYADTRQDSFVVVDTIANQSVSSVLSQAGGLSSSGINAAVYYPWLTIPDSSKSVQGATVNVPPGGAVLGQYQSTDTLEGVFKSPAGYRTRLSLAIGLEKRLTNSELDSLNGSGTAVNAIRVVPGAGIVIMGARTVANTSPNQYINIRRSLIFIKKELQNLSSYAVFENNDTFLWDSLKSSLSNFLSDFWQQGGLRGLSQEEAYYVVCDESTTTQADIAAGRVNIQVGVALQYPAEFIVINIGQIAGSASVVQG